MPRYFRPPLPTAWCGGRSLPGAKLHIFGQLEARLTESDRIILGGLVEGVWPPAPRVDPWLSRPMRHELGLDLPERRIGLSAHDFAQLLGHDDVILTHAAKGRRRARGRLALPAPAGSGRGRGALEGGEGRPATNMFAYAERDRPAGKSRTDPAARTTAAARDAADKAFGYRDRGLAARSLHDLCPPHPAARSARSRRHAAVGGRPRLGDSRMRSANSRKPMPAHLPADVVGVLRAHRREAFRAVDGAAGSPRAVVAAVSSASRAGSPTGKPRAAATSPLSPPRSGARSRSRSTMSGHLRSRHAPTASNAAVTAATPSSTTRPAQPPTGKQVRMGLSPQLTLEAAILREGGFADIDAGASVGELAYVRLSGNNPPGEHKTLELKVKPGDTPQPPDDAADYARAQLEALVRRFEQSGRAVPVAGAVDVDRPLRQLRRPRPHQGMVGRRWPRAGGMVKAPRTIPPAVRDAQARASDPASSSFVSANAGSGKTHVLVQRVIRLLLTGVPPEKILCITFTKAAAANMAERVFTTLGHWVTLDDDSARRRDPRRRHRAIRAPRCAIRRENCSPRRWRRRAG